MKRYLKNGFSILVIVLVVAIAYQFYAPTEAPIKGTTVADRAEEIRKRVDSRYDYISVPSVALQALDDGSTFVRYVVFFTAPESLFQEAQKAASQAQGIGAAGAVQKAQDALAAYRGALIDLLKLTKSYLAPIDPRMALVVIQISFPDGTIYGARVLIRELPSLHSPDEAWLEKASNALTPLRISEAETTDTTTPSS